MKGIYWLLFFWFAPVVAIVALWVKVVVAICVLFMKALVWSCQQTIRIAGNVIKKEQVKFKELKIRKVFNRDIFVQ